MTEMETDRGFTKIHMSRKDVIINNFLGGLFWGLGSVFGATIIIGLLAWLFGQFGAIPFIGAVITDILHSVNLNTR